MVLMRGWSAAAPLPPPLAWRSALLGWSVDWVVLGGLLLAGVLYLFGVRRVRARGGGWPFSATGWFMLGGLGGTAAVTMSFLGTYDRVLFWPLAVQDVLLVTLVPVGLTLGRPVALLSSTGIGAGRCAPEPLRALGSLLTFPLVGSLLATATLLMIYTSGWDQARLEHPAVLEGTRLLLLITGVLFLGPLLGVDARTGTTSYGARAAIAFADGLLDALPGLAVLASGHVIAGGYYARVGRTWGPSSLADQQLGGAGMVALSEIVGLPALLIVLVRWVRADARDATAVDRELDVLAAAERAALGTEHVSDRERPWWETNPGPLRDRAARNGWDQRHASPEQ